MINKMRGGALRDNREEFAQKRHTYLGIVNWPATPFVPKYTPQQRNQEGTVDSMSCVAQSMASLINAQLGIVASAKPIYDKRIGAPTSEGMYLYDAFNIIESTGTCLESEEKSEQLTDAQLDTPDTVVNTIFAVKGSSVQVPLDADSIASAIAQYGGVVMTFESNEQEWDMPNQTPVYNGTPISFGHAICLYGYFMNNGVKTFIANDSDGQWSAPDGKRYITEAFLLARSTSAETGIFFIKQPVNTPPPAPTVPLAGSNITLPLSINNPISYQYWLQTVLLQNRLIQDGVATFSIETGFFGSKTQNALTSYQAVHGLQPTGFCDPATLAYIQQNG